MENPNLESFTATGIHGLKAVLDNPTREISVTMYERENNGVKYWLIKTSLVEEGPEYDQEIIVSNEALEEISKLKSIIEKLPYPKKDKVAASWISLPDGVKEVPVERFELLMNVIDEDITITDVEKRPGYDWVVSYKTGDEPVAEMDVFGSMSIEDAIREAHFSLTALDTETRKADYTILGARRV